MKTLAEQFANIRRVSTPLVQVRTTDPNAVMSQLTKAAGVDVPVVQWDVATGFVARTKPAGARAIAQMLPEDHDASIPIINPEMAMSLAAKMLPDGILFVVNAHRIWSEAQTFPAVQAIWNLRDHYKKNQRTIVLLTTPEAKAPRELSSDIIVLEDPLPDAEQLAAVITEQCKSAGIKAPTGEVLAKCVDAIKGLSAFVAEQIVALALTKSGVNISELWTRKRQAVEDVAGAKVYNGDASFANIGGNQGLKDTLRLELNAKRPVKLVVILDEFEKAVAGGTSEHTGDGGVAKDRVGQFLTYMNDMKVRGAIVYGHPGCGKTEVLKAMANEAGVLCIMADMGAMSGGVVGESEARVRAFFALLTAIAGEGGAFFGATCNSTGAFSTELRRRFKTGFFFVDLPDRAEKDAIWKIQMQRYGLAKQPLPDDANWTGAEIETCCEKADNYGQPLVKVAKSITTVAKSQPELIIQRRKEAHQRLLSAATGETYVMTSAKVEDDAIVVPSVPRSIVGMPES